jgi:ankyrin repeat protein
MRGLHGLHCGQIGHTPLHYACRQGKIDTAELLIRAGADINIRNNVSLRCGCVSSLYLSARVCVPGAIYAYACNA